MQNTQFYPSAINATDCIKNAWNLVGQNYGLYLGISVVAFLMLLCIPCLNIFIAGPVTCGIYYCFLRAVGGENVEFGMMFKGFEKFVPAMVIGLISAIPEIIIQILRLTTDIGSTLIRTTGRNGDFFQSRDDVATGVVLIAAVVILALSLFSVVLRASLFFALPLVMENDIGAVDAMKLSVRAAWSNVGGLILLFILEGLIAIAGFMALCIGFVFVLPILYAANAFAYRQVFPNISQSFNVAPPPPTSYGGGTYGTAQ